jgi:hypothetical protein
MVIVQKEVNVSSRIASGFVIAGSGSIYIGDKATSCRGRLPDGIFTTEWPYSLESRDHGQIDITLTAINRDTQTRQL